MGGGDGVIITREAVAAVLKNPIVLAKVPASVRDSVIRICDKECTTWTKPEVAIMSSAIDRAMAWD